MADVAAVFAILQAGTEFDATLVPRINNATTEVATVHGHLVSAGYSTLAAELVSYDPSSNMPDLASYISDGLPSLIERMSLFSSFAALDEANAAVNVAFGTEFAGRTFVTAVDSITYTLNQPSDEDTANTLAFRVGQLTALPPAVPGIISAQDGFLANATQTIDNYSDALQIIQMFSDYPLKGVLGGVASDALLQLLNPQAINPQPPPPPVDGSNSGLGDPIPVI